jgi:hypothetical protein
LMNQNRLPGLTYFSVGFKRKGGKIWIEKVENFGMTFTKYL